MGCVTALPCKLPLKSHSGLSASCFRQTQGAITNLALCSSKYTPLEAGALQVCSTNGDTHLCPEQPGCTQCSSFSSVPALQGGSSLSPEMLMGLPAYSFLQQIWGQHEDKSHPMLWRRVSIGLCGLLARALLWANMAILLVSHSWQWKQDSCVQR